MKRYYLIISVLLFIHALALGQAAPASEGYFKLSYEQQFSEGKSVSVEVSTFSIFKSNSGWNDSKYYLLINDILPGTIVKIKSLLTEKIVYAKVLGSLVQARENEKLMFRMSNATMAALGLNDTNSKVILTWNN